MVTLAAQIISENKKELKETIEYLRKLNLFDEIVVIADIDNGKDIEESAKLADKYILRSFYTPEQVIDSINELSTCDWNFRLDDDEKVGERFLGIKDFLKNADRDSYWMPRMWIWPVWGTFLYCYHWYPDSQVRIWKRGHLKAELGVHMHPRVLGTSGTVDYHLFHNVLVAKTFEQRLDRCKNHAKLMNIPFDAFRKGIGLFYLPEDIKGLIIADYLERTVL